MERYAILDVGTNSIKYLLFSIEDRKSTIIEEANNITRLGEGLLKTGVLSDEAMSRNIEALNEFVKKAEKQNVREIIAVGTMCLRTAKNSDVFLKKVKDELGLTIEVIPGEEEARLSFLAVLPTIEEMGKNVIIFDVGGGSTEFILGKDSKVKDCVSLNLGVVHLTEEFLLSDPVTEDELQKMQDYIIESVKDKIFDKKADYLIGIGGTVTTMGAVMHKMAQYDPSVIQGSEMTLDEVKKQIKLYRMETIEKRKQIPGLQPKRADVILAGAGIVKTIMEVFNLDHFTISNRGLRHGLMFDRYLK
jgi:exopolyphosphatase/guanosine-5'-triphosphate,3'-diphosphate pyrophosphatase